MKTPLRHRILPLSIVLIGASGCGSCCAGGGGRGGGDGADVMLADSTPVAWNGTMWVGQGTAVAANMILPTSAVTDTFMRTNDNCLIFEGITVWESKEGAASVQITSSMQSAVASYNGTRYDITGLVATPAFAPTGDMMTVTDTTSGDTLAEVVAPEPISDPAQNLGAPDGLQTVFRAPAGQYDVILVYVGGVGQAAGDSGIMCRYTPDQTGGDDVWDEIEMVDPDTIADMESMGITPSFVSVAYHNEEISSSIFDEDIEVHAGRLLQIQYADLVP
jgi:hypothetical protein